MPTDQHIDSVVDELRQLRTTGGMTAPIRHLERTAKQGDLSEAGCVIWNDYRHLIDGGLSTYQAMKTILT